MNSLRELFDFGYIIRKGESWLYAYMFIYLLYAFTTGFEDPLLALSIIVFLAAPLFPSFLMFIFYLLWEYVTTFSFGITVILIMQLIMVMKILVAGKFFVNSKSYIQSKSYTLQSFLLVYILIMGVISFVLKGSFTGFGMAFKVIITFYSISFLYKDSSFTTFLKSIFHVLVFSTIIATIYGLFHDTSLERWVSGMGDVTQLYGTLGTTRMALFYLISMSFFLYYVSNKVIRSVGFIFFTMLTLMTVSLTAIALYLFVLIIYYFSTGKISKTMVYIGLTCIVLLSLFPFWSKLSFVEPIVYRASFALSSYRQGDTDAALTGREDLADLYMAKFLNSDISTQILGNAEEAVSVIGAEKVAHNTYIDVLFYFGYLGLVLIALYQLTKYALIKRKPYFYPLITMKVVLLLGASTVSIMSATYFFFLIFI